MSARMPKYRSRRLPYNTRKVPQVVNGSGKRAILVLFFHLLSHLQLMSHKLKGMPRGSRGAGDSPVAHTNKKSSNRNLSTRSTSNRSKAPLIVQCGMNGLGMLNSSIGAVHVISLLVVGCNNHGVAAIDSADCSSQMTRCGSGGMIDRAAFSLKALTL